MPRARVLLLEDDPPLLAVLRDLFALEDINVTRCDSLADLQAAIARCPKAVVVSDSWARGDHQTLSAGHRAEILALNARAAVILTTGRTWATDPAQNDLGTVVVIPKPYDLDRLLAAVRTALANVPAT